MSHRLAPEAVADLDEVWYYMASNGSVETADRVVDAITTRFSLLGTHPRAGRRRNDLRPGLRAFPVGDYLVFYRVEGDNALIQRVIRGNRDLEAALGE